jgi:hypothetical protein
MVVGYAYPQTGKQAIEEANSTTRENALATKVSFEESPCVLMFESYRIETCVDFKVIL